MSVTSNYEVAGLPDGQFEVRILGGVAVPMTFASRAEAEAWVFAQDEVGDGLESLKPGMGQGV